MKASPSGGVFAFSLPAAANFQKHARFSILPRLYPGCAAQLPVKSRKKQQQRGYLGKTLVFVPVADGLIENKPRNQKMVFNLVLGIEHTFYEHLFGLIEHLFGLMLRFHEETQNRANT